MHSESLKLTQSPHNGHHTQHLPTELLIAIVDQVTDDEDLLALAITSHHFHALSLNHYFKRYNFDPYSKEINIHSRSYKILGGLSIFLDVVGTSIERLSYDCGHIKSYDRAQITKEAHLLANYVAKLSSVKRASLFLAVSGSVVMEEIIFLNTILGKCCNDIHIITTSQFSSFPEQSKNMPANSKPSEWLKDYWPLQRHSPRKHELNTFYIQSFPQPMRPFYFYTLNTNSVSITNLTFKCIFGGGADWATMLAHLHFPYLRRFAVIYGVIPRDPFIKFLAKHPGTLTAFEYHHIRYEPRPKNPTRSAALTPVFHPSLESLTTSPEHINNFFPSLASMSRLTDVIIKIEEPVGSFSGLEGALKHLAVCVNKITLTLTIIRTSLGFGAWFSSISASKGGFADAARPERRLRCVEALVIDNSDWGFMDNIVVAGLPRWVGLFPELRALTLRGRQQSYKHPLLLDEDSKAPEDFMAVLKEACPGLYVEYIARDFIEY